MTAWLGDPSDPLAIAVEDHTADGGVEMHDEDADHVWYPTGDYTIAAATVGHGGPVEYLIDLELSKPCPNGQLHFHEDSPTERRILAFHPQALAEIAQAIINNLAHGEEAGLISRDENGYLR